MHKSWRRSHLASAEISCCHYSHHSKRFFSESPKLEKIGIVVTKEIQNVIFMFLKLKHWKFLAPLTFFNETWPKYVEIPLLHSSKILKWNLKLLKKYCIFSKGGHFFCATLYIYIYIYMQKYSDYYNCTSVNPVLYLPADPMQKISMHLYYLTH